MGVSFFIKISLTVNNICVKIRPRDLEPRKPKKEDHKMTWFRDFLIVKSKLFLAFYCLYINIWNFVSASREDRKENWRMKVSRQQLIFRKFKKGALGAEARVLNRIQWNYLYLPLLPNWFLTKEWHVFGKKFQLTRFKWFIYVERFWKRDFWNFWKNIDIHLGKLGEIAIRWQGGWNGKRCYVAIRLWLREYKDFFLPIAGGVFGTFELVHEIHEFSPKIAVSRWWWGSGWLRLRAPFFNIYHLYHHFGGLIRFHWRGRFKEFFGKKLSTAEKEMLYEKRYIPALESYHDEKSARYILDAIHGTPRSIFKELFPSVCIKCRIRFNPSQDDGEWRSQIFCEECSRKEIEDASENERIPAA